MLPSTDCQPGPMAAMAALYLNGYPHATYPRWSPDGDKLAFVSTVDGSPRVYWSKKQDLAGRLNPDERDTAYQMSAPNCFAPSWIPQRNGKVVLVFTCLHGQQGTLVAVPAVSHPTWEAHLDGGIILRDNLCWLQ